MIKLKNILQSKYIFFILLLITIISSLIRINLKNVDIEASFEGVLENYTIDGNKISFILKNKYSLKCTYYIKDENELNFLKNLNLGIVLRVEGNVDNPKNNTIPNTFNYKKYLKSKNIFKVMSVENYKVINYKPNIIYTIKNKIIKRIDKYKSKRYISAFILGDKKYLDDDVKNHYQELGVSHIFAISGMHVSLITGILFFILKKIKDNLKYFIVISFLVIYVFLTGLQASVLRSVSFFIVNYLNKKYSFDLDIKNTFLVAIILLLIIYPNLIMDIGFQYSSIISFSLINFNYLIKGNYFKTCLTISIIAFLVSLPITINNNFEINILSILNNLFIVPYISYILYPLSILTFFIPILDNLLFIFCNLIEVISSHLLVLNIIIPKMNIITIIIYYLCLYIFLKTYKKIYLVVILCLILINKYFYIIDPSYYIYYLDVSQGDSSLIRNKNEAILIDTGGSISFKEDEWKKKKEYHITDSTITFLKSIGVSKIDYLILTHGDADHMGEAINLVNNFKVEKVIFNCESYNDLEKELIKVLDKKKIKYYSCIKELNIDNNKLYFLQTKEYDNENDNSNVIYTELNGYKFMFMGDASSTTEKEILNKYNLPYIDVLKVGHHGSKTSSSKELINEIKPNYSIISVGKNNRYGHPNKEVLDNLEDSKIYRTDQDGSIIFKIKNNKLKIETCSP